MRRLAFLLTAAVALPAAASSDCRHTAARALSTPAAGVTRISIIARAGSLEVKGQRGAAEIRASGTACAPSESVLREINLSARKSGGEVVIEAHIPEQRSFSWSSGPSLPFTVAVPDGIPIEIRDSSGALTVADVASLELRDGSGEIVIRDVAGDVRLSDGSGAISIRGVGGAVHVTEDGSGEINIEGAGSVVIDEDGSGGIDIDRVRGSVTIKDDGSGSIEVEDVGGDVLVRNDGSGGIQTARIAGRVEIPRKR